MSRPDPNFSRSVFDMRMLDISGGQGEIGWCCRLIIYAPFLSFQEAGVQSNLPPPFMKKIGIDVESLMRLCTLIFRMKYLHNEGIISTNVSTLLFVKCTILHKDVYKKKVSFNSRPFFCKIYLIFLSISQAEFYPEL